MVSNGAVLGGGSKYPTCDPPAANQPPPGGPELAVPPILPTNTVGLPTARGRLPTGEFARFCKSTLRVLAAQFPVIADGKSAGEKPLKETLLFTGVFDSG